MEEKVGRCICSSLQRYIFYCKNTDDEGDDGNADDIKEDDDDGAASAQHMWNISPSSNTCNAVQYTVRW